MTDSVPQPVAIEPPKMTQEQADAYSTVLTSVKPLFDAYYEHQERVNEQARVAARPIFWIAGVGVVAVGGAALWAVVMTTDAQLSRDLLLPLLSFIGGLGLGRSVAPKS